MQYALYDKLTGQLLTPLCIDKLTCLDAALHQGFSLMMTDNLYKTNGEWRKYGFRKLAAA